MVVAGGAVAIVRWPGGGGGGVEMGWSTTERRCE